MRRTAAVLVACATFWNASAVYADQAVVEEVSGLLEQGHLDQAAKRADAYLRNNPGDVQVRFLQGVIATEQGSTAKAIDVFTALAKDYPQLPEPFNNLAVLYAAQGDERKAVDVLESAIRTNPSYATAHENLGDLYARMASEAYAKALQLDDSRKALQPKLSLIKQIFPVQETAPQTVAQAQTHSSNLSNTRAQEAARLTAQAQQADQVQKKQDQEREQQAKAKAEQAAAEKAAAEQRLAEEKKAADKLAADKAAADKLAAQTRAAEKAADDKLAAERAAAARAAQDKEEQKTAVTAPATLAASSDSSKAGTTAAAAALDAAVKEWADAWASQNMERYFAAYSTHFKPADGSSFSQWKEQRTQRIVGRPTISVQVRNLKTSAITADSATVQFRQTYSSGAFKASTQKTLRMQKEAGKWRIVHEGTGG
ncbi:tetratricopeptide repeat protein [Lampropedia puyangensis]|uniref:Tetratricopeptide repeat protein n=2 Tax=Lampropedia puyangensis TaxID=1330072 RepID=A0A4S8EML3_9BURK|nr:tetratricopeptide repeat protein [Lampropedia puyangensis]